MVSVIDGGFKGFSDSDDDIPNSRNSRATTPVPIIQKKEDIELFNESKAEQNLFSNYRRNNKNKNLGQVGFYTQEPIREEQTSN